MGRLISIIENSDIGILQFCLKIFCEHESDGLAWRLIDRFGSISGIFSASQDELMQIDGVTERIAAFFTVMRPLQRQAQLRRINVKLTSPHDLTGYAAVYFLGEYGPSEVCVCLDKNDRIICVEQPEGDEPVREIAAIACRSNAKKIALLRLESRLKRKRVLPLPDKQRQLIKIARLMSAIGVEFVDYIEYKQRSFFSLRRAVRGDIGVYNIKDADVNVYQPWNNAVQAINEYYAITVMHAKERRIRQA